MSRWTKRLPTVMAAVTGIVIAVAVSMLLRGPAPTTDEPARPAPGGLPVSTQPGEPDRRQADPPSGEARAPHPDPVPNPPPPNGDREATGSEDGDEAGEAAVATETTGWFSPHAQRPDSGGDGDGFEKDPESALLRDDDAARDRESGTSVATSCNNAGKDRHIFGDFGVQLSGSAATIDGIEVGLRGGADSATGRSYLCVQLYSAARDTWTEPRRTNQLGEELGLVIAGLPTDDWVVPWTAADLVRPDFQIRVISVSDHGKRDFFLDWVGVRLTYH